MFEIFSCDLAGRIGKLYTNHGKIETPAYVPVIHPAKQGVSTQKIKEIGFDLVITNAYIAYKRFGNEAAQRGIHDVINFDGAVMTDSGGYQVLEYGDVEILPKDMAKFEREIMTDIAIPLDKPTGFKLPKKTARDYVEHTLKVSKQTLAQRNDNGQIWVGPIQGGEHFDLVKKSTQSLAEYGFDMLALGSPVEFMESYEYRLLAEMILVAKKEMPDNIPLHLFGAGHPLTIPVAIAFGCDTFDSASYILYAKQDRYMTEDRTRKLSEIAYFSCVCEVCSKFSPKELYSLDKEIRVNQLALHNLYAIKSEVDRTKEAIKEGRLWEYLLKKLRSHPKLYEIIDIITGNSEYLARSTPLFKEKALFLYTYHDQYRPEVISYHKMVRGFRTDKKELVISKPFITNPAYLSREQQDLEKRFSKPQNIQFVQYSPFLGLIPLEISDIYPASHNVASSQSQDPADYPTFEKTWKEFFSKNKFDRVYYDKDDSFLDYFAKKIPAKTRKLSLKQK